MEEDQVTKKPDKEECNMVGTTLAAFIALALAGTGLALLVWWLWRLWEGDEGEAATPSRTAVAIEIEAEEPAEEVEAPAPDDLKRIEGIGPKTESVLQEGGIHTYAQLAAADPDEVREILRASDPRLASRANPISWSKQAALAAVGDWEKLDALQSELKGGRLA